MADLEVLFSRLRWPETDGNPVCPHCNYDIAYNCGHRSGLTRYRCGACQKDYTALSESAFAYRKMTLEQLWKCAVAFSQGKNATQMSKYAGVGQRAGYVIYNKFQEAFFATISAEQALRRVLSQGVCDDWKNYGRAPKDPITQDPEPVGVARPPKTPKLPKHEDSEPRTHAGGIRARMLARAEREKKTQTPDPPRFV